MILVPSCNKSATPLSPNHFELELLDPFCDRPGGEANLSLWDRELPPSPGTIELSRLD
jgi:hypothetical protein